jgi:Arc/MetJ-type ribon-helix-helix transcriptional regulator
MVIGMTTRKVTVTLDARQLDEIRALVSAGSASSVSGFVQHAVRISLSDARDWTRILEEALEETGGPLTDEERRWADEILGVNRTQQCSAAS